MHIGFYVASSTCVLLSCSAGVEEDLKSCAAGAGKRTAQNDTVVRSSPCCYAHCQFRNCLASLRVHQMRAPLRRIRQITGSQRGRSPQKGTCSAWRWFSIVSPSSRLPLCRATGARN